MEIKIKSLKLTNFKGLRSFEFTPDGKNTDVFGDNALGKTTIYDAFLWLLFDKDSAGASSFGIKTRENGVEIQMLDHVVEAVVVVDDREQTLKKTLREKWVKKRGRVEQEFEGHECIYEINGVPKSKREFDDFVAAICPENIFRLVTNPTHFNEKMKWQDRRQMLLDMFGGVTVANVIESNQELSPLIPLLSASSVDDVKKVKAGELKRINDELKSIPLLINEASKAIPETTGNTESLMVQAQKVAQEIATLNTEKTTILNGGASQVIRQQIAEIDTTIAEMRAKHLQSVPDVSNERKNITDLRNELGKIQLSSVDQLRREEQRLVERSHSIHASWQAITGKKFVRGASCPTCNQQYPDSLEDVLEANFNRNKAVELENIVKEGQENGKELETVRRRITENEAANKLASDRKVSIEKEIAEIEKVIASKLAVPTFDTLPEYRELESKKQGLQADLLKQDAAVSTEAIDASLQEKEQSLKSINHQITLIETAATQKARVEELKARQKELATTYEAAERVVHLLDLFERTRAEMLDDAISGEFEIVRWKLSDTQINGGVNPTCVCTVKGVPYSDLNNAGKPQAGLDIIKTFSRKHDVFAPVFVDNAESITVLPDMECQVIRLVVSEADKELRVVVAG